MENKKLVTIPIEPPKPFVPKSQANKGGKIYDKVYTNNKIIFEKKVLDSYIILYVYS